MIVEHRELGDRRDDGDVPSVHVVGRPQGLPRGHEPRQLHPGRPQPALVHPGHDLPGHGGQHRAAAGPAGLRLPGGPLAVLLGEDSRHHGHSPPRGAPGQTPEGHTGLHPRRRGPREVPGQQAHSLRPHRRADSLGHLRRGPLRVRRVPAHHSGDGHPLARGARGHRRGYSGLHDPWRPERCGSHGLGAVGRHRHRVGRVLAAAVRSRRTVQLVLLGVPRTRRVQPHPGGVGDGHAAGVHGHLRPAGGAADRHRFSHHLWCATRGGPELRPAHAGRPQRKGGARGDLRLRRHVPPDHAAHPGSRHVRRGAQARSGQPGSGPARPGPGLPPALREGPLPHRGGGRRHVDDLGLLQRHGGPDREELRPSAGARHAPGAPGVLDQGGYGGRRPRSALVRPDSRHRARRRGDRGPDRPDRRDGTADLPDPVLAPPHREGRLLGHGGDGGWHVRAGPDRGRTRGRGPRTGAAGRARAVLGLRHRGDRVRRAERPRALPSRRPLAEVQGPVRRRRPEHGAVEAGARGGLPDVAGPVRPLGLHEANGLGRRLPPYRRTLRPG